MTAIASAIDPCCTVARHLLEPTSLPNQVQAASPRERHGRFRANSCALARQFVHDFPDSCTPFPIRHFARDRALTKWFRPVGMRPDNG
jgi:hypothetical protein